MSSSGEQLQSTNGGNDPPWAFFVKFATRFKNWPFNFPAIRKLKFPVLAVAFIEAATASTVIGALNFIDAGTELFTTLLDGAAEFQVRVITGVLGGLSSSIRQAWLQAVPADFGPFSYAIVVAEVLLAFYIVANARDFASRVASPLGEWWYLLTRGRGAVLVSKIASELLPAMNSALRTAAQESAEMPASADNHTGNPHVQ